jgi:pullulanase
MMLLRYFGRILLLLVLSSSCIAPALALTVTIHYQRPGNDYASWGLHVWGGGLAAGQATPWASPKALTGSDGFGRYANVEVADGAQPLGFIVHRGDTKDVTQDRFFTPTQSREVWLRQGDPRVYTSNPDGSASYGRPGVTYGKAQSTFALWSPDTANVQLWLDGGTYAMSRTADANGYRDVYAVTVPGDWHLKPYHFIVNGKVARDPYGVMVRAGTDDNIVVDLAQTEPLEGWAPAPALANREDAVIYEVHVRDFTIDATSGVEPGKRGKFLGMVQPGTSYSTLATGIDHLVDLGVTHVQMLPFYDFGSCSPQEVATRPDCYNWGYDPVNFNVPEERYSQTPDDYANRVRELKTMINEFHKRGIRVVMDVVYNHTQSKQVLGNITGRYYTAGDLSGTGNSLNSGEPMVSRMIRDSLEYWVREYRVDGFRFDLLGVFHTAAVGEWVRHLQTQFPERKLLIYGEPWNGFAADPEEPRKIRLGTVGVLADAHVGVFNGKFREALKGGNDDGGAGGFIFNQGGTWGSGPLGPVYAGKRGSIRYVNQGGVLPNLWDPMFALDPEQSINYVDAHDNLCLNDKVERWAAGEQARRGQAPSAGYKRRIQEFALATILTSQGIPFLHGGSEMLRTKFGDSNSYKSSDEINKYRWNWKLENERTYQYVRALIALRRAHPGFRMTSWDQIDANVRSNQVSKELVVTRINAGANRDGWSEILLIDNSGANITYALPDGIWNVVVEKSEYNATARQVIGSVVAEGTAVTVLYR